MNRCRIHVQATNSRDVACLIDLGWSFSRWSEAHVEAYVASADPIAALRSRLGRPEPGDLVIAELPGDPAMAAAMARMLLRSGHRGMLLPPRQGPDDHLWGGWNPDDAAAPSVNAEAALCASVIEQHLRWRGARPQGYRGDLITSNAIAAVFNGARPTWPRHRLPTRAMRQADRLLLGTIGPDGPGPMPARWRPGLRMGWLIVPGRPALRMSDAIDAGSIAVASPCGRRAADARLRAHVGADAVRFTLPGTDAGERGGLAIDLRAGSLLDPMLHQAWQGLRELLLMPQLRCDLLAAPDDAQRRRVLLLDDDGLVAASAGSTAASADQEGP